ncbi:MAG TPA: segregation/condensation protein A, partial [Desulfobacteraceae bacterium]|nr:segregation/condensation protein A [Desulfobacteraceae bacterium]
MTFTTKLEIFEGPLDLLLHLIKINEVEISDIPIATITDQYLEYLDLM